MPEAVRPTTAFWKRLALLGGLPSLGVALSLTLTAQAVPWFGLGEAERIRQLGIHLNGPFPRNAVAVLGDSVLMEGIDGELIDARPIVETVENLALTGCTLSEQAVVLPKLIRSRPMGVAISINLISIAVEEDLPADKAYAYALGRFADAWPAQRSWRDIPGFSIETDRRLRSTAIEQWLHLRAVPRQTLNLSLRDALRNDLSTGVEDDWRSPHVMQTDFTPQQLDWHAETVLRSAASWTSEGLAANLVLLEQMRNDLRTGGVRTIVIVSPVHPRLLPKVSEIRPQVEQALARLAAGGDTRIVDACDWLDQTQFADALHPNEKGRIALSERLGKALSSLSSTVPESSPRIPGLIAETPRTPH